MKKNIIVSIGICSLLLFSPLALGFSIQKTIPFQQSASMQQPTILTDEPPAWAKGNFSGVWGFTLIGVPLPPVGWITGYYQVMGSGKVVGLGNFDAKYAQFNTTNATSFLRGIMLLTFFLGRTSNLSTNKRSWVFGIGIADDIEFFWRLNAIIGPSLSFYILCNYTAFGNATTLHSLPGRSHTLMHKVLLSVPHENIREST
ncbi:MAG: hypothetical protein JW840_08085 [Candidatus Thermoplasmatota archaeon]|nr:hypothetical protein [Candidatus Thermoplasmatota archaeon]